MRQAGTLQTETDARRLCDYLLTQGIGTKVEPDGDAWILWVYDEDELDRVRAELEKFRANPRAAQYDGHSGVADEIRTQADRDQREAKRNYVDVRKRWASSTGRVSWRQVPVTSGLIGIMAVVYFTTCASFSMFGCSGWGWGDLLFFSEQPVGWRWVDVLIQIGRGRLSFADWFAAMAKGTLEIRSGQVWRLFTPSLLHSGLLHIGFNSLWLWQLGAAIERRKGWLTLSWLVLFSGIVASLTQFVATGPLGVGFSGCVYALLGYVWMRSRFAPQDGLFMPQSLARFMIGWLIFGIVMSSPEITGLFGFSPWPIGNGAHFGGLVFGVAAGYAPVLWQRLRP